VNRWKRLEVSIGDGIVSGIDQDQQEKRNAWPDTSL
jgi:hypothetical protein